MTVTKILTSVWGSVLPSFMTVPSFITIKWQEKKSSMIKIFKVFISDHLKRKDTLSRIFMILFLFEVSQLPMTKRKIIALFTVCKQIHHRGGGGGYCHANKSFQFLNSMPAITLLFSILPEYLSNSETMRTS